MEIKINEKTFIVRELLAIELDEALEETDKKLSLQKQIRFSTGLSVDEYNKLTVKERIAILKAMNKLNGIDEDFQKAPS